MTGDVGHDNIGAASARGLDREASPPYLICPRCRLSIRLRGPSLRIVHCPRCVAHTRTLVELFASALPAEQLYRNAATLAGRGPPWRAHALRLQHSAGSGHVDPQRAGMEDESEGAASMSPRRRLTVIAGDDIPEPPAPRDWEVRVAREARHQAMIEAAFDRVDECERHGEFARALEWLTRAEALGGGLPPAYDAKRARYSRELARPPEPKVRTL